MKWSLMKLRTHATILTVLFGLGATIHGVDQSNARADVFHMPEGLKSLETVVIADPENRPDDNGQGRVNYPYKIGTYEVTAAQYAEFLNATAKKTDPHDLRSNNTEEPGGCQIKRTGEEGNYHYDVAPEFANFPVNEVCFWDACRFANWLHNGQGNGDTETGVYTLKGRKGYDGRNLVRTPGAKWFIPTEDEWYKAAYYDPHKSGGGGYWKYPTRSNESPGRDRSAANSANNYVGGFLDEKLRLTHVGTFAKSPSAYGTYDQSGNVFEWNETLIVPPFLRGFRGGSFASEDRGVRKRPVSHSISSRTEAGYLGFRIAGAVDPAAESVAANDFPRRPLRNPENGKPFFPMGWFDNIGGDRSLEYLRTMAEEKANVVLYVAAPTDVDAGEAEFKSNLAAMMKYLDEAQRLGMKVLIQCGWYGSFRDNETVHLGRIRKYVETVSAHPALLAYQLYDEPEYKGGGGLSVPDQQATAVFADALKKTRDGIRKWDKNPHRTTQVVFNLVPLSSWVDYLPAVDTFQVDRYPLDAASPYFPQGGGWGPLMMPWSMSHGVAAMSNYKHLLNPAPCMQGVGTDSNNPQLLWRTPLYEETRYMAYASMTVGTWGVYHWIYNGASHTIRTNVARLHAELRQLIPALEASYEKPPFQVTHAYQGITRDDLSDRVADITTLTLEDRDNLYLISADNTGVFKDVSFRMKLPQIQDTRPREAAVLNESWSLELEYDEATAEWIIPKHPMRFGDVNIWVIPKVVTP